MKESDFFDWRQQTLTQFQSIENADEIYDLLQQQTQNLEFDYFALCIKHPVPFTRPRLVLYTSYPQAWIKQYQEENYFAIDPVLKPQNYVRGMLNWSDELFAPQAEALWEQARNFGLRKGVTQCVITPARAQGYLSVCRSHGREKALKEGELELRLQHLIEISMMALNRLDDPGVASLEMKLSKREKEILQWTAEGKTSAEIAIILAISENTVNFHQKNMQKKFNAPNKTQIACYAAAIGLI